MGTPAEKHRTEGRLVQKGHQKCYRSTLILRPEQGLKEGEIVQLDVVAFTRFPVQLVEGQKMVMPNLSHLNALAEGKADIIASLWVHAFKYLIFSWGEVDEHGIAGKLVGNRTPQSFGAGSPVETQVLQFKTQIILLPNILPRKIVAKQDAVVGKTITKVHGEFFQKDTHPVFQGTEYRPIGNIADGLVPADRNQLNKQVVEQECRACLMVQVFDTGFHVKRLGFVSLGLFDLGPEEALMQQRRLIEKGRILLLHIQIHILPLFGMVL
ncbi:hypothetical protein SDC9_71024 [bioreactor metagenome]|uniref:Uncharacterized protein n=1 Tax=bioreactor metagenome TaxID=1076179 RepID=A0A644Y9E8_9ZZZZ